MRTQTLHADHAALSRSDSNLATRLFRGVLNRFLLLPIGALLALIWANLDPEPYYQFAHGSAFVVNEIAMAVFLALIAQELHEALMPGGELHHWHAWTGSVLAALGGIAGCAAVYWLFVGYMHEQMLASAWPVAAAVDLAAGYYVMRLIYPYRHAATTFVLLAAVVTDGLAMAIVTLQAPGFRLDVGGVTLLVGALSIATTLRWGQITAFWPYWVMCAPLSWLGFYWMGLHPALSLIPIVPLLPHAARRGEIFADRPDHDAIHFSEHTWNGVAQVALFLFGLVNAGVVLQHADTGTWAVLVAAVLGRPAGILLVMAIAMAAGLRLPGHMRWADLIVAALATTSGFTFALFLSSIALPIGAVSQQVTIGALATVGGALLTIGTARRLYVGRFKTSGW